MNLRLKALSEEVQYLAMGLAVIVVTSVVTVVAFVVTGGKLGEALADDADPPEKPKMSKITAT